MGQEKLVLQFYTHVNDLNMPKVEFWNKGDDFDSLTISRDISPPKYIPATESKTRQPIYLLNSLIM